MDTNEVIKKYDLAFQYGVFEPWLKENGFTIEDLPLTATTELGEEVVIECEWNEDLHERVWKTSVLQQNGWLRVKRYYADHTIEETYEH